MHALARPVVMVARPKMRTKVKAKDIKRAIDHASQLCMNFEDTVECRLAWEKVEELSIAYNDQKFFEKAEKDDREAIEQLRIAAREREYDV